jgi:hypothetical protein
VAIDAELETADKMSTMRKIGVEPMTVAEMAAKLAGLPPMMEIFANADGTSMFLNDLVIERHGDETPPFARLHCSAVPVIRQAPDMTREQLEAMQRQRAMALSAAIAEASTMHAIVE